MPKIGSAVFCAESNAKKIARILINRVAADPGLDAKPAAGDERAHQRGNIRAARPKRRAAQNREGMP